MDPFRRNKLDISFIYLSLIFLSSIIASEFIGFRKRNNNKKKTKEIGITIFVFLPFHSLLLLLYKMFIPIYPKRHLNASTDARCFCFQWMMVCCRTIQRLKIDIFILRQSIWYLCWCCVPLRCVHMSRQRRVGNVCTFPARAKNWSFLKTQIEFLKGKNIVFFNFIICCLMICLPGFWCISA